MSVSVLNRCSSDLLPTAPHSSPLPPVLTCVSLAFSAPSRAPPEMLSFFDALHEANASAAQPSSAVVQTRFVISLSHAYLDVNVKSAPVGACVQAGKWGGWREYSLSSPRT